MRKINLKISTLCRYMENIAQYEIEIDVDNTSDLDNEKNEIISNTEENSNRYFPKFSTISSFKSVTVFQNQIKYLEKTSESGK